MTRVNKYNFCSQSTLTADEGTKTPIRNLTSKIRHPPSHIQLELVCDFSFGVPTLRAGPQFQYPGSDFFTRLRFIAGFLAFQAGHGLYEIS